MTDLGYHTLTGRPQAGVDGAPSSPPRLSTSGQGAQNAATLNPDGGGADMAMHPADHPSVWFLVLLFGAAVLAKSARIIA